MRFQCKNTWHKPSKLIANQYQYNMCTNITHLMVWTLTWIVFNSTIHTLNLGGLYRKRIMRIIFINLQMFHLFWFDWQTFTCRLEHLIAIHVKNWAIKWKFWMCFWFVIESSKRYARIFMCSVRFITMKKNSSWGSTKRTIKHLTIFLHIFQIFRIFCEYANFSRILSESCEKLRIFCKNVLSSWIFRIFLNRNFPQALNCVWHALHYVHQKNWSGIESAIYFKLSRIQHKSIQYFRNDVLYDDLC